MPTPLDCARFALTAAMSLTLWGLTASPARAAVRDFPGSAPCNTTLQACIDGVTAGDVINIAAGTVVTNSVLILKSLTLTASPSANPPRIGSVTFLATTTDIMGTVEGLSIRGSISGVVEAGGGNLHLNALRNAVDSLQTIGIELREGTSAGTYGRKSAEIEDNAIRLPVGAPANCATGIQISTRRAQTTARVSGNRIAMGPGDCSGISAYLEGSPDSTVTIDRNEVRGDQFAVGISARNAATPVSGRLQVRVFNNIVAGQDGSAGSPGSIQVSADARNSVLDAQIINNTVTDCRDGIGLRGNVPLTARVTGIVANNIVAGCSRTGLTIDETASAVMNGHNLLFGNGVNLFTAGPGTRYGDPRFVDPVRADFRLAQGSDAVDRGLESALPGTERYDVYGAGRRFGQLDIGAAEADFLRPPEPVPATGGAWRWLLAALIALAAWASRSRSVRRLN